VITAHGEYITLLSEMLEGTTATPEPGSMLISGVGLAVVAASVRRKVSTAKHPREIAAKPCYEA